MAQREQDPTCRLVAHETLTLSLHCLGEFGEAHEHAEQFIALYVPEEHRFLATLLGQDSGVDCLTWAAHALWSLGYPDQALKRSTEAVTLAHELAHPHSTALALSHAGWHHHHRRDFQRMQEYAEAGVTLSAEHGLPFWETFGRVLRGWTFVNRGQTQEGLAEVQRGLAGRRAIEAEVWRTYCLAILAEAYREAGQPEAGLATLAEAISLVETTDERFHEAELYRLKGELLLNDERGMMNDERHTQQAGEGEACFLKAIEVAQRQSAKSWELRAATSLAHLWQEQGKQAEAHQLLSEIYGWFTEGFDTKDLQDAQVLLQEVGG